MARATTLAQYLTAAFITREKAAAESICPRQRRRSRRCWQNVLQQFWLARRGLPPGLRLRENQYIANHRGRDEHVQKNVAKDLSRHP
jgi:hypothetical protein